MGGPPFKRRSGPDITQPDGAVWVPLGFMHPCKVEGCDEPAPFGFRVSLLRDKPGDWYCQGHKHLGETERVERPIDGDLFAAP